MAAGDSESVDHFVELELSLSQVKAIFVLAQAPDPLPIHALAERMRLSVAATGRTVDLLVTAGLAERRENPADRRVKLVTITQAGLDATEAHIEAKKNAMRAQIGRLDAAEADRLHDALIPLLRCSPLEQELSA
ncbi:MarR family transcriptional regulator [Aeromicrobium fastidiosum]|uniref:MarR family transcriptional regulator n=2 Tax=Aeromicrobium fastidiosum TaxID=52699 RepID=A0A641AS08_9ACTN|nr:MarR family transcriptional regulator [Aeromicrobium fastidiosum]